MSRNDLTNLALSDNGFLFDTSTGFTYTLNEVATTLLRAIISGKEPDEIADDVTEHFDVDFEEASRDMQEFLARLKDLQIVLHNGCRS